MITPSVSILILALVTAVVALGFAERVLERMRLSSTAAIIVLLAMAAAHFLPDIEFQGLTINLGALVLLGIVIYLIVTTTAQEALRAVIVGLITGAVIWLTDKLLPVDPSSAWFSLDPLFVGGIASGLIAYVLGRSRRSAFCGAILGTILVDLANMMELMQAGIPQSIHVGAGGLLASVAISPLIAVAIAEGIGEIRERLHRGSAVPSGGEDGE